MGCLELAVGVETVDNNVMKLIKAGKMKILLKTLLKL